MMIKVQNVQNENEYKYIDKHELKEWVDKQLI